jgi:hypothetical protein
MIGRVGHRIMRHGEAAFEQAVEGLDRCDVRAPL